MKLLSSRHGLLIIAVAAAFLFAHAALFLLRPDTTVPLYAAAPWVDIPFHIIFGAWVALLLLYPGATRSEKSLLLIFFFVTIAGIGWELIELGYDHAYAAPHGLPLAHHGWGDTAKDVFDNGLGAAAALFAFGRVQK